jgi:hypothetical protein
MVSGLRNCGSIFVHYIQAGKTHADAILMEAILYRDALESRWLSTLREIFSSSMPLQMRFVVLLQMCFDSCTRLRTGDTASESSLWTS